MFLSTLVSAVGVFGCGGRQNSLEKSVFCLLWCPQALDLGAAIDKNWEKGVGFVYFSICAINAMVMSVNEVSSTAFSEGRCGSNLKKAIKKAFKTKADHLCKTLFNVYVITRKTK